MKSVMALGLGMTMFAVLANARCPEGLNADKLIDCIVAEGAGYSYSELQANAHAQENAMAGVVQDISDLSKMERGAVSPDGKSTDDPVTAQRH